MYRKVPLSRKVLIMISGVHTIIVQTTDMERSVGFYRDVLCLEPGYISEHWSDFALGDKRLGIHPLIRPENGVVPFSNTIIGVATSDIAQLRRALEEYGSYVSGEYHDTPSGVVLDFLDPDGNNWQAIQLGAKAKDIV